MTIEDFREEVKKDLKLHHDSLNYDAVFTPDIHHKYSKALMVERLAYKKLKREYDVKYLEVWEYYKKRAPEKVYKEKPLLKKIMDTDVKYYISADRDLQEIQSKLDTKEELIEFLKRTLEQINNRQWLIKSAIDYLKFTNGGSPSNNL